MDGIPEQQRALSKRYAAAYSSPSAPGSRMGIAVIPFYVFVILTLPSCNSASTSKRTQSTVTQNPQTQGHQELLVVINRIKAVEEQYTQHILRRHPEWDPPTARAHVARLKDKWINCNRDNERECIIEMYDFGWLMYDDRQLTIEDYRDVHRMMSTIFWNLGQELRTRIRRGESLSIPVPDIVSLDRNDPKLKAEMAPLFREDDARLRADLAEYCGRNPDYYENRKRQIGALIDDMHRREASVAK